MNICAGIVLFNPEIERLNENIEHIRKQVAQLVLVDNGSDNLNEVKDLIKGLPNVILLENGENLGIAQALNRILKFAGDYSYEWVLTLDQDSVADDSLIEAYKKFLIEHTLSQKIGCLTCNIVDRNFNIEKKESGYEEIDYCITSGSLMNVEKTFEIGGFDESMFIDKVDCDICINMRKHGYKIIRINYDGLLHEIGHAKQINLGFRKWELYNHSSFRRYYMCRNASYLLRKYHNIYVFNMFLKEVFQFILVFLFEDNKKEKAGKGLKGFADGFRASKTCTIEVK